MRYSEPAWARIMLRAARCIGSGDRACRCYEDHVHATTETGSRPAGEQDDEHRHDQAGDEIRLVVPVVATIDCYLS